MAEAEKNKEQTTAKEGETPSMEEILQSIRGVISGDEPQDESDVLELTEIVEEEPVKTEEIKATAEPKADQIPATPEKSILDDIDAALDENTTSTPEKNEVEKKQEVEEKVKEIEQPSPITNEQETKVEISTPLSDNPSPAKPEESTAEIGTQASSENIDIDINEVENATKKMDKSSNTRLLGEQAAIQSSGSLKELVSNIHDKHVDSPYTRSGTSLEDLVIEAMKPFLADWLNKNLPVIVKKIVEKEVKRLIPKEEDEY